MEHPEKNHPEKVPAAEQGTQLIEVARKEIIQLRDLTRKAKAEGKTQKEEPLLQYSPDFEAIILDRITPEEAHFLELALHGDTQEAFDQLIEGVNAFRKKIDTFPAEERTSHHYFMNFVGNKSAGILFRAAGEEPPR